MSIAPEPSDSFGAGTADWLAHEVLAVAIASAFGIAGGAVH